jgi:hypothetical protein
MITTKHLTFKFAEGKSQRGLQRDLGAAGCCRQARRAAFLSAAGLEANKHPDGADRSP